MFKSLIHITGEVLFVLGLALNICMVFFGFWPSFIYILIMLFGALVVYLTRNNIPESLQAYFPKQTINTGLIKKALLGTIVSLSVICLVAVVQTIRLR